MDNHDVSNLFTNNELLMLSNKMEQLTLVDICNSYDTNSISYQQLLTGLDFINTNDQLESLLITCINNSMIYGKLNDQLQILSIKKIKQRKYNENTWVKLNNTLKNGYIKLIKYLIKSIKFFFFLKFF